MVKKPTKNLIFSSLFALGTAALVVFFFYYVERETHKPYLAPLFRDQLGFLGPLIIIALHFIQVMIFFLPGSYISVFSGFVYGWQYSVLFNFLGSFSATLILFRLAQLLNKNEKWQPRIQRYNESKYAFTDPILLILCRFTPIVPNDLITIATSLANMPFKIFAIASLTGYIPTYILEGLYGESLSYGLASKPNMIMNAVLLVLIVVYLFIKSKIQQYQSRKMQSAKTN